MSPCIFWAPSIIQNNRKGWLLLSCFAKPTFYKLYFPAYKLSKIFYIPCNLSRRFCHSSIVMTIISKYLENLTDRWLVGKFLAQRDERSFHQLYRRHTPALYQSTLRLVGWNVHDAEDVVQEAWIKAVEKLEAFRWESSLRTWLSGIAINCCRELYRRRSGQHETVLPEEMEQTASRIGELERIDIERAIASLPDGYRQVLVLHDIEGYTHEEIGSMLDIEIGTSKSQLSRARTAMRKTLQGERHRNEWRINNEL